MAPGCEPNGALVPCWKQETGGAVDPDVWKVRDMGEPAVISGLLDAVACEAIGATLDLLAEGAEVHPTAFFAVRDGNDADPHIEQAEFSDDTPDLCLEAARNHVRGLGAKADVYAIAYDGFVQESEDEPAQDAVIVEFGERGAESAYSALVLYRFEKDGSLMYSEPQPAGEEQLLL